MPARMTASPRVRVVVVNHDGGTDLARCVGALAAQRVVVREGEVEIVVSRGRLENALTMPDRDGPRPTSAARTMDCDDELRLVVEVRLKRGGSEAKIIVSGEASRELESNPNPTLIKAVARGCAWQARLVSGEAASIKAISRGTGLTDRYVSRLLPLACLAPDIVEAILDGRQPSDLTLDKLLENIPLTWDCQRSTLRFAAG